MLLSLTGLMATWLAGSLLAQRLIRPTPDRHWALSLAVGWCLGVVLVSLVLAWSPPSLSTSALWLLGILLAGSLGYILIGRPKTPGPILGSGPLWPGRGGLQNLALTLILILLASHLALALFNIVTRPVFGWDAFTTWMYRAKLWVLDDAISPLSYTLDWIAAGGSHGGALYAQHYPETLSVIAAFSASLAGGDSWHLGAGGLPWVFTLAALGLGMYGALRLWAASPLWSVLGAYACISLPLLGTHTALYGYADLWLALFSGLGLSLLLLGRDQGQINALLLGALLLALGTLIKTEGWIWFGLGALFVAGDALFTRVRYRWLLPKTAFVLTALWYSGLHHFDLGPLGEWGIAAGKIHAGPLGSFAIRPYNPLGRYAQALFLNPNFHLLGVLYLFSLLALVAIQPGRAGRFWLLGGLIAATQGIIFGASAHSEFAEIGTAINRLLLHFVPVFVVTTVVVLQQLQARLTVPATSAAVLAWSAPVSILAVGIALAVFLGVGGGQQEKVQAEDFVAVVGSTEIDHKALRLTHSSGPVGVVKAPNPPVQPGSLSHALVDVRGPGATQSHFYWVTETRPILNSIAIPAPGPVLLDLAKQDLWDDSVIEVGLIVPREQFEHVDVRQMVFYHGRDFSALPAMVNHWRQPIPVTQVSLNALNVPLDGGIPLIQILNTAAVLLLLAYILAWLFRRPSIATPMLLALALLWLASDVQWLWRYGATTRSHWLELDNQPSYQGHEGYHLTGPAAQIRQRVPETDPVIVIPADRDAQFEAQKLPFLLLPLKSVFVEAAPNRIPRNWQGSVVIVGLSEQSIKRAENRLKKRLRQPVQTLLSTPTVRVLRSDGE